MSASLHPLCVDAGHPSLEGHFPDHPVVPGVLILDAVLAAVEQLPGLRQPLRRLPQVKFLQPLLPGQAATIELAAGAADCGQQRVRFRVLRDALLLASGELVLGP
jgi:3-hydroxymyristoyl/3-hydroxydecanoyl-(acyl carrier protein) dehydratase